MTSPVDGSDRSVPVPLPPRTHPSRRLQAWALAVAAIAVLSAGAAGLLGGFPAGPSGTPAPTAALLPTAAAPVAASPATHALTPRSVSPPAASPAPAPQLPSDLHLVAPPSTGPTPNSWGGTALPPGAILPGQPSTLPPGWGGGGSGSNASIKFCNGIWPDGGQSIYAYASCYGHDEPGIDFYSSLPGSGGNVSWNLTLPVDRSPTLNQSDLYSAIWLGMTLTDPSAWMDACFLELQFYPDSSWYAPGPQNPADTVYGQWVGEAVAWQIQASTGAENPCFISPLFENGVAGPTFFNMSQGDRISVQMSGWTNDPWGENISIHDLTNGAVSSVNLYNRTGDYANEYNQNNRYIDGTPNYPLDPSYVANNMENGLSWTPGGELPIAFAFEVGHGGNPTVPGTNPYGGCSPGVPPNNPSTPCPSYDPGSWLNDTKSPWEIAPPVFSNGSRTSIPTQVGFSQDIGALNFIDNATGSGVTSACESSPSTAWCDYPWYSYSCSEHAFNFGATDWPSTSDDFGQDKEWSYQTQYDSAGLGYYPPSNVTIPACGASTASVTVGASAGGTAYFLTHAYAGAGATLSGLSVGNYSLSATPTYGNYFAGWVTTGAVTVTVPGDEWTNLAVAGDGSVTAQFTATPPTAFALTAGANHGGGFEIVAGIQGSNATATHVANGSTVDVEPGIYSILGLPGAGYNFTGWSLNNSETFLFSPTLPYTYLDVPVGGGAAKLIVRAVATSVTNYVYAFVASASGSGTVSFNGNPATPGSAYTAAPGGFSIAATPATGWRFAGWESTQMVVIAGYESASNWMLIEQYVPGYDLEVAAVFAPAVTLDDSAASDGGIALASLGLLPAANGTTLLLSPGTYTLAAVPNSGYQFSSWTVSSSSALFVPQSANQIANLVVNTSGTVTAHFAAATSLEEIWLNDSLALSGSIEFNYVHYYDGGSNASVAPGEYAVFPRPAPGYAFSHWEATGDFSVVQTNIVTLSGATGIGSLTAVFAPVTALVTFTGHGTATLGSATLSPGRSAGFLPGSYALALTLPTNATFLGWSVQGGVSVADASAATTTLSVDGPGTVTAFESAPALSVGSIDASAIQTPVGTPVYLNATVLSGPGPFTYRWTGCAGLGTQSSATCVPTVLGNFTIDVNVTDAFGDSVLAPPLVLEVETGVSVLLAASPASVTLGNAVTFTATPTAGTPPFTYQYVGVPLGCGAPTTSTFRCTPTQVGVSNLSVLVVDARGFRATATIEFGVNPVIALIGPVATPANFTLGTSTVITTQISGGTYPLEITYADLPPGCASTNSSTLDCAPTATGTYLLRMTVTDAGGGNATGAVALTVNPLPSIASFTASAPAVPVGTSVSLAVDVSGGTAPYTFSYSGLPSDCPGANTAHFACTSSIVGNYTVKVVVTDADGKSASAVVAFAVQPAPASQPSTSSGGLSALDWIVIAIVVVAAIGGIGAAIVRRRRGGAPPSDGGPPSPTADEPAAPAGDDAPQIYGSR